MCALYGAARVGYYAWRHRGESFRRGQDRGLLSRIDQVRVGDITYLKVGGTWRYLAVVMDRDSRRIIGWSLGRHKDARLTLAALNHAVVNRRPQPGLIFDTDRGIEYAAYAFRTRLAALGFVQSMNRPRQTLLQPRAPALGPRLSLPG